MAGLLLAITLFFQGIPVQPLQSGTIVGVLRAADGKPQPNTRVAAVAQPLDGAALQGSSTMSALAETDAEGRYRLENIPPGKYYVAAGNIDIPTYYPGTRDIREGRVVAVAAGTTVEGIDFQLNTASASRAPPVGQIFFSFGVSNIITAGSGQLLPVPLQVQIEGGGPLPVSGSKGFTTISMIPPGGAPPITVDIVKPSVFLQGFGVDYRVTLENLPDSYALKSMTYDKTDLRTNNLNIPPATFASLAQTQNSQAAGFASPPLMIVLTKVSPGTSTGVRVTGKAIGTEARSIYLSGVPGTFFADGTFEFQAVPPGRHVIDTIKNPVSGKALAADIVVGDRDLAGIQLEATQILPLDILTPTTARIAGTHPAGSQIPLVMLHGKVVDSETKESAYPGMVFLNGGAGGTSFQIQEDGTFQFGPLLPGRYNMELNLFGHQTEKRTVAVDDDGANLVIPVIRKP